MRALVEPPRSSESLVVEYNSLFFFVTHARFSSLITTQARFSAVRDGGSRLDMSRGMLHDGASWNRRGALASGNRRREGGCQCKSTIMYTSTKQDGDMVMMDAIGAESESGVLGHAAVQRIQ
jgi:hypothetical protein